MSIQFTTFNLDKLVHLTCDNFSSFEFDFANLNDLKIDFSKLKELDLSCNLLLNSLSKCTHLQYLNFELNSDCFTHVHLQSLVDTMGTMTMIEKILLYSEVEMKDQTKQDADRAILIDQSRLKSVKECKFVLKTKVIFNPCQSGVLTFDKRLDAYHVKYET